MTGTVGGSKRALWKKQKQTTTKQPKNKQPSKNKTKHILSVLKAAHETHMKSLAIISLGKHT